MKNRSLALAIFLGVLVAGGVLAGLGAGAEGWSWHWRADAELIESIRAPRTLGAALVGALLGLAGAIAQGLFRNPLAEPYLLGAASGAGLGVVLALAAGGGLAWAAADWVARLGLVGAAFVGAAAGVGLTLAIAGGAARPLVLLLCGVVTGVVFSALTELVVIAAPEVMRARQVFLLGNTGLIGWPGVAMLGAGLALVLVPAVALARVLDALVLGEASATSLGLALPRLRLVLVALMALATACAVAQAGLIGFVGLVAPHLVRRALVLAHGPLLALSALAGAALLVWADVASRLLISPEELPVGVLTAVLGGAYLLLLLRRGAARS